MVRALLDGELSKTSEFGRTLDKYLLKLAPLVEILHGDLAKTSHNRYFDYGDHCTGFPVAIRVVSTLPLHLDNKVIDIGRGGGVSTSFVSH